MFGSCASRRGSGMLSSDGELAVARGEQTPI
jgi:hypothetical protein